MAINRVQGAPSVTSHSATVRLVRRGAFRAVIPLVILWGMALALQLTNKPLEAKSTFFAGEIVSPVAGFSVIYDVESWTLL